MELQQTIFEWVLGVGGVLSVIFGVAFAYKRLGGDSESQFRADILSELKAVKDENKSLRDEHADALRKIASLEAKIVLMNKEFQTKAQLFESAHSHLPVPMWLKDLDGKMLALNHAYERVFLKPQGIKKEDYIGYFDHDVWPDDVADQFMENDLHVMKEDVVWRGIETMKDIKGIPERWHIIKYVRKVNGIAIGIGGLAIDLQAIEAQME